jgi:uncharacterized repeat protein (TIGR01451 family)
LTCFAGLKKWKSTNRIDERDEAAMRANQIVPKVFGVGSCLGCFVLVDPVVEASHSLGTIVTASQVFNATSGTTFSDPFGDTKFVILHFTSGLEGNDKLVVDLGYGTDVFTAASGSEFWTRPISGGTVSVTYMDDGNGLGSVTLDRYGRGQNVDQGTCDPMHIGECAGIGNADIFLQATHYSDPPPRGTGGLCGGAPPTWQSVSCLDPSVPAQAVMSDVSQSVGMFVMISEGTVTSCSAALIGPDLILTAAHCAASAGSLNGEEVDSGSFTLDFLTDCANNRPAGYSPHFYKLKRRVSCGFVRGACDTRPGLDYAILQIDTGGNSLGVPLTMRSTAPVNGESVFGIHHPRGTPKKVSRPGLDPCTVMFSYDPCTMKSSYLFTCDVDNGSSGSPVFDAAGNIIGVAVTACCLSGAGNGLTPTSAILNDISSTPPPCNPLSVVTVFDQSGSMQLPATVGSTKTKLQAAQEATAMFIDLLRLSAGDKIGVVPFSTTASEPPGSTLDTVTESKKTTLIGSPPDRNGGVVGALSAGGSTSIGDGLQTAQSQLNADTSGNTQAILLMTDGMQNTAPFIEDVEGMLGSTKLCIVGFGTEASLNGPLLTRLALDHGGDYTRASEGLELKKFYVLCFGNIFSSSSSMDPFYTIPAGATNFQPIPFRICGETMLTAVISWENADRHLFPSLETPAGAIIDSTTSGVLSSSGGTWHYLRLQLPFNGEQDGTWKILLPKFASLNTPERFFASTVVEGGPYLRVEQGPSRYYTGDSINPLVRLNQATGFIPRNATVTVEVTHPVESAGNILTQSGLGPPTTMGGDPLDARTSTLTSMESNLGRPLIDTVTETFPLYDDTQHGDGAMEPDGIFGNPLTALTRFEGTYTFHAIARYGGSCLGTREATWSLSVGCGLASNLTTITTQSVTNLPNGLQLVRLRFAPRDIYGNNLGPGQTNAFTVGPISGSVLTNAVQDAGDGSYLQDVIWTPSAGKAGLVLQQAGRSDVVITTSVGAGNRPPLVAITSPGNNQTLPANQNITINAAAFDPDGSIASVQFFNGFNFLGQSTNAPYNVVLTNPPPGNFLFTAVASDNFNLRATSAPVRITVATNLPGMDLALTKSDTPHVVRVQKNLTYTLIVENNGFSTSTGVVLTDPLPPGTLFCGVTSSQGSSTYSNGVVECSLGTLMPGASAMVTIVLVPTQIGYLTNEASVSAKEMEVNMTNNTAVTTTLVYLAEPVIQIRSAGTQVTISWTPPGGILQQADSVSGTWFDVPNATNPTTLNATGVRRFYRILLQ